MDPFVAALDALFNGPGSAEATYSSVTGGQRTIRVIRSRPDALATFAGGRVIEGTNTFEIRRSEVDLPAKGDWLALGAETFRVLGDPIIDVEGLTWTVGTAGVI